MGIENYIFIVLVYGLGVFLAWKAGFNSGILNGIKATAKEVAEISDKKESEILKLIIENRRRKALKS